MPKQSGQSPLNSLLKGHAHDEVDYGVDLTKLPGGITGGVAKLVEARVGIYKKGDNIGEKFVFLVAAVITPKTHTEIISTFKDGRVEVVGPVTTRTEGLRTTCNGGPMPLCATGKGDKARSTEDNVKRALNEIKKVGGKQCTASLHSASDQMGELENILSALKKAAPLIRFNTRRNDPSAEYPTPRAWEDWRGTEGLEDFHLNGASEHPALEATEDTSTEPDEDMAEVVSKADESKDSAAMKKLNDMALALGIEQDAIDGTDSWQEVWDMIQAAQQADEPQQPDAEPYEPAKGDHVGFKPKGSRKIVQCEVTSVDKTKETVSLKELATKRPHKGIDWSALSESE